MKTIQELLMHDNSHARISGAYIWMYYDTDNQNWCVRQRRPYERRITVLFEGDEAGAVAAFANAKGLEEAKK